MVIDLNNYEEAQEEEENNTTSSPDPEPDNTSGDAPIRDEDGDFVRTVDEISEAEGTDGSNTDTVVVPESPAERDKLQEQGESLAVGQGSSVQEARRDAARNPDFDADTGDSVNQIEKNLGTNQPLQNPQGSSNKELRKAAERIAGNEKFQGERIGRQAGKLAQQLKQRNQQNQRQRTTQNVLRQQSQDTDLDGRPKTDTIGEKLFEIGKEGTFQAQQLSKEIQTDPESAEFLAGDPGPSQAIVTPPNPFNIISTGLALDDELESSDTSVRDAASLVTAIDSEEENRAEAVVASDLAQDTVEDTSAVVGGIGASTALARGELREEGDIQDAATVVATGAGKGLEKQAEVLSNNPEELRQEAIGLAGDVGTIGVPSASVTPAVTSKASNVFDVVQTGASEAAQLRANAKDAPSTTEQVIQSAAFEEVQTQTGNTAAVATESRPATENPIAQPETSQITQDSNFVPQSAPEVIDLNTGTSETVSSPTTNPGANVQAQPQSDILSRPESDTLNRPDSEIINIPDIQTETNTAANTRASATTSAQAASQTQTLFNQQANTQSTPSQNTSTSLSILGSGDSQETNLFTFGSEDVSSESEAAPSVDAILFGDTTNQKVEDNTVFTGFETREIEDEDVFNLF